MNKQLPNKWVRKAVFDLLNNITVDGEQIPCYDMRVTLSDGGQAYFIVQAQTSNDIDDNKCENLLTVTTQIEVVTTYPAAGNTGSRLLLDNILNEAKQLLTPNLVLEVASGLTVLSQRLSFPNTLVSATDSVVVFRGFITLLNKIQ